VGAAPPQPLLPEYDYIVVGAGAAGSIIAGNVARALPHSSVLLLEAGPLTGNADNAFIRDPALWLHVVANDTLEWRFESKPQPQLANRSIALGFVKGTGGSAMHNGMAWVRGGHSWIDRWESQQRCPGWNDSRSPLPLRRSRSSC